MSGNKPVYRFQKSDTPEKKKLARMVAENAHRPCSGRFDDGIEEIIDPATAARLLFEKAQKKDEK